LDEIPETKINSPNLTAREYGPDGAGPLLVAITSFCGKCGIGFTAFSYEYKIVDEKQLQYYDSYF